MSAPTSDALELARTLRASLRNAVGSLEEAAAAPASAPGWRVELSDRIHEVRTALITHIDEVEAESGLLSQAASANPALGPAVAAIRDDHGVLCEEVDQVLDLVDPVHGAEPAEVRAAVGELMQMISQHRQAGADLVYEAWRIDVAGPGGQVTA